jgi:hypothetical protein
MVENNEWALNEKQIQVNWKEDFFDQISCAVEIFLGASQVDWEKGACQHSDELESVTGSPGDEE